MKLPLFLLFVLFTFACEDDDDFQDNMTPMGPTQDTLRQITYLALGDSYTIGTSVTAQERWPDQLSAALADQHSIEVSDLDIIAVNGWTTRDLINGINAGVPRNEYDLVSLLIGVNNQYQGKSIREYELEFWELLNTAISYAGGDKNKVFVVSIPDYAFTPFGGGSQQITDELVEFNASGRRLATEAGIPFYNITPISQEAQDDPELVASDNLHPSGKQYARWVEEVILAQVARLLEE
ncbi:SGNH/GDSL hydrolase family protein [Neolewinella agarilytica]|uniref:Lysophospholipase L1 n=1 Tax=Neolewinella agarilytica TaxID=478744 RepID=A0A1H8YWN8_9BACT|nr:SGNH/GDSL hydrolase family protein [Neolewinella agarilytica]SEP56542.1 Lysophospholipase L1 [Neolewinella agarilytica]